MGHTGHDCSDKINEPLRRFGELLTAAQPRLYAFALTLVADFDRASDVVQEANRELWEHADQFDPERDFTAWACGVVRYRVLAQYRDQRREKLRFGMDLVELIADEMPTDSMVDQQRRAAFNSCFQKLTDHQRMLIETRYEPDSTVAKMAEDLDRTAASISTALTKIRRKLTECVERVLAAEATT